MNKTRTKVTLASVKEHLCNINAFQRASPLRRRQTIFDIVDAADARPEVYQLSPEDKAEIESWAKSFMKRDQIQGVTL